jgi:diadenylate cyclase
MAVELCLIIFVVYTIMRFLRGTGGEKLFRGIIFVVLGFWAVSLLAKKIDLDLERIELLFKYFLGAVLVVAIIAFQPELRRGLMRLGGTRFGRSNAPQLEQVIEQVVDAVSYLSRTQIGAVIAFERDVGLGDLIAGGTKVSAVVSADLLNTIFWPGSPLHDMGVVIRRGRIAAASVQFPLAEHGEFDRMLGSRHRSAIGLSKETDAVVVVVSEESGQIGLALDGKLTRYLTIEQLHHQLQVLLIPGLLAKSKSPSVLAPDAPGDVEKTGKSREKLETVEPQDTEKPDLTKTSSHAS